MVKQGPKPLTEEIEKSDSPSIHTGMPPLFPLFGTSWEIDFMALQPIIHYGLQNV